MFEFRAGRLTRIAQAFAAAAFAQLVAFAAAIALAPAPVRAQDAPQAARQQELAVSLLTLRRIQIPKTPAEIEGATVSLAELVAGTKVQQAFIEKPLPRNQFFGQVCGFEPNFPLLFQRLGQNVPPEWRNEQIPVGYYPVPPCPAVQAGIPMYLGTQTSVADFVQLATGQTNGAVGWLADNLQLRKKVFPADSVQASELKTVPTSFVVEGNRKPLIRDPTLIEYPINEGAVQPDDFFADTPATALCKTGTAKWPYDEDLLSDTLGFNEKFQQNPQKVTIGIIDSGLIAEVLDLKPRSGTTADCGGDRQGYFLKATHWPLWFAYDDNEAKGPRCDDSNGNGWFDDVIGIDATLRPNTRAHRYDSVLAHPDHKFYQHGTGVAKLALGGLIQRDALQGALQKRLNLKFVKVALEVVDEKSGEIGYTIPQESIQSAIEYLVSEHKVLAQIINISSAVHDDFGARLRQAIVNVEPRSVLIVAAAGNKRAHASTSSEHLFPADFGGTQLTNVVTVAGHNRAGGLYESTNWDATLVDLAAPGCDVPTLAPQGDPRWLATGTSFASPLVAFTAALLKYEGLTHPKEIKLRIGLATDYREGLEGKVVAAGTLNIPKALNIWTDYLERRGAAVPLRGYLEGVESNGRPEKSVCDVELSKVLKLAASWDGDAYKGHRVYTASKAAGIPGKSKPCPLSADTYLIYRLVRNNEYERIPIREVVDYVQHQLPADFHVDTIKGKIFGVE